MLKRYKARVQGWGKGWEGGCFTDTYILDASHWRVAGARALNTFHHNHRGRRLTRIVLELEPRDRGEEEE